MITGTLYAWDSLSCLYQAGVSPFNKFKFLCSSRHLCLSFCIGCSSEVDNPTAGTGLDPTVDIAKTGGVKIDSDTSCSNGTEDNHLCGDNIIVWFSAGSNSPSGAYCYRLTNRRTKFVVATATITFGVSCTNNGATFWRTDVDEVQDAPCTGDAYTAKVTVGSCGSDSKNLGSDSFNTP